jgi:hypothetical protein
MSLAEAYDEILEFLAAGTTTAGLADFRPSAKAQQRVTDLVEREASGLLSPMENQELEECLRLQHLMVMAKAKAPVRLQA